MKILTGMILILSFTAFAKEDFNQAILQDVKTDIQKDEEKFRKVRARGPASVTENQPVQIQDPEKIEKNVKQIGHKEW